MATETKPESAEQRALTIVDASLKNYRDEFVRLLGSSVDPEMFMSVAYEAFRTNPDLLEIALNSPDSLMKALHDAAALKLVPNGVLGSAYIVPRKNKNTGRREAYFQVGYRGLEELIMRSGHVSNIQSRVVYANEPFAISYGTDQRITHEPILDGGERGKVRGFYAVARMRDGSQVFEYMTVDQVNAIRERSPSKSGPWSTDYEEMGRKTIIRRLAKALPMSIDIQKAIGLDDLAETAEVVATVSEPAAPAASLAGRIRQTMATAEPAEQITAKAEPKNVTPESTDESGTIAEPERDTTNADLAAEAAARRDEPPAAPAPKARTRKATPKAHEWKEEAPAASDDVPDDESEPVADATKYGSMANGAQTWQGSVFAKGDSIRFRNDDAAAPWIGKLIAGDPDVERFFGSLDDSAWRVTIAGDLKLVPWEKDGTAMPPFRQIEVKGVEVSGASATWRA